MIYNSGLSIQKDGTAVLPINILSASEAGHNGQVIISGQNGGSTNGIDLGNHSYINIQGAKWRSIRVAYFSGNGVNLGSSSQKVKLINLEVDDNGLASNQSGSGISIAGSAHTIGQLMVHDNAVNITASPSSYTAPTVIIYSWITNLAANTANTTDGVQITDAPTANSYLMLTNSIIGPGLATGINIQGKKAAKTYVSDCLLLSAQKANLSRVASSENGLDLFRVTSFMTRHNVAGKSHAAMQFTELAQDLIRNSVVMGGVIQITGNRMLGHDNVQFNTEGNTTLLSANEEEPKFRTDLGKIPSAVSVSYLASLDYSLRDDAAKPAYGLGSTLTSVNQLLSILK